MKKIINPNEYGSLLFDKREEQAIINVLKNEKIFRYASANESKVDEFEKRLCEFVNSKYSLGVVNGTAGLITALIGCGIKEGDRVLVSAYTFLATALAVKSIGAIPVPVEIDLITGLDLEDFERELKKGCKAAILVQHQGRCFDMSKVIKLTKKYKVVLIEDACQALGAKNKKGYAGTFGDVGVYSFQQFKQITCGEGGAVVTNNKTIFNKMRNYSDMGSNRNLFPSWSGSNISFGQNYRMNNLSGSIICEQMIKLQGIIDRQIELRDYILKELKTKRVVNSYYEKGDTGMNILLLLDSLEEFNTLKEKALKNNIEIRKMWNGMYFENDLFKDGGLTDIDLRDSKCSKTKDIIDRLAVISIPPILSIKDCDLIINFLNNNLDK